ncbi:MAG TPA: acetyl ornithine aminotransferase family protein [Candidatus Acidoferrales bacterium]|nr:acetyl ornithine aminotransferase family protein [Candidatus Acidoferrales bacterium]
MKAPYIKIKPPGPKAKALVEKDQRFTAPAYGRVYPLVVKEGRGMVVEDVDGNLFLDFMAGIAVASTGHSHPKVVKAIEEQARKFLHICGSDFYYEPMIDLCEKLAQLAPGRGPKKVFLTNSGTESIEAAFKLARYATKRNHAIAFHGAFHGRTMGSLSLTASRASHRELFSPLVPGIHHIPYGAEGLRAMEKLFRYEVTPAEVAAIFVEPIQGEGGYVVPEPEFLPALQELCRRHGILLVADEIQSGFGRTGKMFACEHFGVEPDILCVAKGIASGMPLGAMIARDEISTWTRSAHGTTFGGNPVACAAALATLRVIEDGLVENAAQVGGYLKEKLTKLQNTHSVIKEVRGLGLMIGVDFMTPDSHRAPDPKLRDQVMWECFERGLLLLNCGESTLRFCPPLIVNREEVDAAVGVFAAAITAAA